MAKGVKQRKKFHEMTDVERIEIARIALPFINSAILAYSIISMQEFEAIQVLQNTGVSELIHRRGVQRNKGIITASELAAEIWSWEMSEDEYFAAQDKLTKKKQSKK